MPNIDRNQLELSLRQALSMSRSSPHWNDDMREGAKALAENLARLFNLDLERTIERTAN